MIYLSKKQIREFEDNNSEETISIGNDLIGRCLNFEFNEQLCVKDSKTKEIYICAKNHVGDNIQLQHSFCINFIKQKTDDNPSFKLELFRTRSYPMFHLDWNHLIEAIKRLKEKGIDVAINTGNVFVTWKYVLRSLQYLDLPEEK